MAHKPLKIGMRVLSRMETTDYVSIRFAPVTWLAGDGNDIVECEPGTPGATTIEEGGSEVVLRLDRATGKHFKPGHEYVFACDLRPL